MNTELHFTVTLLFLNRIFRTVEKEVSFFFNFIRSARKANSANPYGHYSDDSAYIIKFSVCDRRQKLINFTTCHPIKAACTLNAAKCFYEFSREFLHIYKTRVIFGSFASGLGLA